MEKLNRFKIYSSFISKNKISHLKSYISISSQQIISVDFSFHSFHVQVSIQYPHRFRLSIHLYLYISSMLS